MSDSVTTTDFLAIDFGTSNTTAAVLRPDGSTATVLFDGCPLLPSAVCAAEGGRFATGRDAGLLAATRPERFEPAPKRCVDDGVVLLGHREYTVEEIVAAVLGRALDGAGRIIGGRPGRVVLTFPPAWGPDRRLVLVEAARRLGVTDPMLLPEPVAAARFLGSAHPDAVPPGATAVVCDFGGGSFAATVLRRTTQGFAVLATEGLPDAGGLDLDTAIVDHLAASGTPTDPEAWHRLVSPETSPDRHARRQLWEAVRAARELLSREASASVRVPLLDRDLTLTRERFELIAEPVLDRTVAATRAALRAARTPAVRIAAIFLVGGSSRIPLAATLLHGAFGLAPTAVEQPELVVARGGVVATARRATRIGPAPAAPVTRRQAHPGRTATRVAAAALIVAAGLARAWRRRT